MKYSLFNPLLIWSVRDVLRNPLEWFLTTIALALITAIPATALLLVEGITATTTQILAESPSLIIRKIDPSGWQPVPVEQALAAVRQVPGVVRAYPRLWGIVAGPAGPLTVTATAAPANTVPGPGQAVTGPAVAAELPEGRLSLTGQVTDEFKIVKVIPRQAAIAANDLVFLNPADARRLLGLTNGYASDIAVDVYHAEEESAIIPDLIEALPWPARITTRTESLEFYSGAYARRGGIVIVAALPAFAALCLLVAATVRERLGRRFEVGLLKAFGWTTADIVRHFIQRALFIGLPAVCLGMLTASAAVLWPGIQWPGRLLFGWQGQAPALYLEAGSALLIVLLVAALTLVPFLIATLIPALKVASADTQDYFEGNGL
jgi:hypothetical protein